MLEGVDHRLGNVTVDPENQISAGVLVADELLDIVKCYCLQSRDGAEYGVAVRGAPENVGLQALLGELLLRLRSAGLRAAR
jgi:hypothetical protein